MIATESPAIRCERAHTPARIRVIDSISALDRLESSWDALADVQNDPLCGFAYARAWADTLGTEERLRVFVNEGDQALAIAPLVRQRGGAGWLTQLAAETYEILDFPHSDEATVFALARAIHDSGHPLFLNRVPGNSPLVAAIVEAYQGAGWVRCKQATGAPYIPLDETWREPEAHLNSGRRSDLRRARRHAAGTGEIQFEIHSPSAADLPRWMEQVFRVEAAGWKGASGTALAADDVRRSFYQRYAALAQRQGILRVCFLRIGERAAAAQLAVETARRFSLLKVGYDEEFSRCSPGMLLTVETIRYAAERGLQSYDFNGKVERWTEVWTQQERPCCSLRAYPLSFRGLAALGSDAGAASWQKLRAGKVNMK